MRPWEIHPALVHFPLALLLTAVALDLYAAIRGRTDLVAPATWLMIGGVASGVVAAAAGVVAFATVPAHTRWAHMMMYWHLGLGAAAIVLFGIVAFARWRGHASALAVRVAGVIGALILSATGYVGGSLILRGGAGVDPALLAPGVRTAHSHDDSQHHDDSQQHDHKH